MSVADARVSGIIKTEKDHTGKQAIGVHISDTMDTHVQPTGVPDIEQLMMSLWQHR